MSRSFYTPDRATHIVAEDGSRDRQLHAVLIVGMVPTQTGLDFLARNSWGPAWGARGHAWLPATYADSRGVEIIEVEAEQP
jgi:C1A family cysteine protease